MNLPILDLPGSPFRRLLREWASVGGIKYELRRRALRIRAIARIRAVRVARLVGLSIGIGEERHVLLWGILITPAYR